MKIGNKRWLVTLVAFIAIVSIGIIYSSLYPWSKFNCTQNYVDVNSGRLRSVRFICFLKVYDMVQETEYSKLWKSFSGNYPKADWQPESTLQGFWPRLSPHYAYLGVILWEDSLLTAFETTKFDRDTQKQIIESFSTLLRTNPIAAERFSHKCLAFAVDKHVAGQNVITNVPVWLLDAQSYLSQTNQNRP